MRNACCEIPENLRVEEIRDEHGVYVVTNPDLELDPDDPRIRAELANKEIMRRCRVCGLRHFMTFITPGRMGVEGGRT